MFAGGLDAAKVAKFDGGINGGGRKDGLGGVDAESAGGGRPESERRVVRTAQGAGRRIRLAFREAGRPADLSDTGGSIAAGRFHILAGPACGGAHLVEHHLRPSQMAQGDAFPTARAIYRYYRELGDAAVDTLYLNLADYLAARGPDLDRDDWVAHSRTMAHILEGGREARPPSRSSRLIDGNRIMREFSLEPGPQIGRLLELVEEAQASGEVSSAGEVLDLVRTTLRAGGTVA